MAGEHTILIGGLDKKGAGYAALSTNGGSLDWTASPLGTWDEMWRILCSDTEDYLGR